MPAGRGPTIRERCRRLMAHPRFWPRATRIPHTDPVPFRQHPGRLPELPHDVLGAPACGFVPRVARPMRLPGGGLPRAVAERVPDQPKRLLWSARSRSIGLPPVGKPDARPNVLPARTRCVRARGALDKREHEPETPPEKRGGIVNGPCAIGQPRNADELRPGGQRPAALSGPAGKGKRTRRTGDQSVASRRAFHQADGFFDRLRTGPGSG